MRAELAWAVGALAAVALCAALAPLVPLAYAVGRWGRGADR